MSNTYSTSTLFSQFVDLYMSVNGVAHSDALGWGDNSKSIAWQVANGGIDFENFYDSWADAYKTKWSNYNLDVAWDTACNAIYRGQQRLMNILTNPNYPSLTGDEGISINTKTQADQYALVFRLMSYADVSSSFDVAAYVPAQFVTSYASYFNTATDSISSSQSALLASTYCSSAANLRSQVILTYMGVSDAASTGYRNATWSNYSSTADSNLSSMPTYQALFGNQEYMMVPEFQSILSPGSYLVDLDKCERSYVVKADSASVSITFPYRRPDIAAIDLSNPANTTSEVSQLSIGINLLALQLYAAQNKTDVVKLAAGDPDVDYNTATQDAMADAVYPFSAPFNYNLAKTRSVLNLSNTSLADIWNAYRPASQCSGTSAYTACLASIYRDRLGLSAETSNLLTSPATSSDLVTVNSRYGIAGSSDNTADLSKVENFESATGLTGSQVENLLYLDLSDTEISNGDIGKTFYVNNDGSDAAQMTIDADSQTIQNTSATRLDRMNRFIRLANATGYSFTDLNSILGYMFTAEKIASSVDVLGDSQQVPPMQFIGRLKAITDRYGRLGVDACLGLVGLLRNYGEQNGPAFIARVFGSAAPGYGDAGVQNWIPSNTSDNGNLALTFQIMNGLGLSQNDLLTVSTYVAAQFGKTADDSIPLTQDFLSALYRVAISARLFGLSVNDMLFLLDTLSSNYRKFAGPFSGSPRAVNSLMLDAFEAVQGYADMAANAGLSIADAAFLADSSYQNPQSAPGLNATLTLLTDISQAVSNALLTKAVLATWITGQNSDFPADVTTVDNVYTALITASLIDDQGVVLTSSMTADQAATCFGGNGISLDATQLDAFNSLLAEYEAHQAAATNGVLGQALSLSAEVAQTASTWGTLISASSSGAAMANVLHVLYTLPQDTLAGASVDSLTAEQAQTQIAFYGSLSRLGLLVNTLGLGRKEVEFLVAGKATKVQPPQDGQSFSISPAGVQQVVSLHGLVDRYADTDNNLLVYLGGEGSVDNLAAATGWSADDINTLVSTWKSSSSDTIALVSALQSCMSLSQSTGLAVSSLLAICGYTDTTGNQNFAPLASQVEQGLYAANPAADKASILRTMNISLNQAYRDVLVDALLYAFSRHGTAELNAIKNVNALSEYLLFDVEVGGKFVNSVVEEATNAYQTFFYRIIMQLEPLLSFNSPYFTENLWPWFRNYRVWEANREVFVTPENYLEPELRPNPSDIFTTFANNLQAGTLSDSIVQNAFNTYVNEFHDIANLNIVASNFTRNGNTGTIQLIGQTYASPAVYYYRTGTVTIDTTTNAYTPTGWTAWNQITTGIPAQFIHTIYAFNRLFVFWIEYTSGQDSQSNPTFQATIKYCFYTLDGGWSTAQVVDTVNMGTNLGSYAAYAGSREFNSLRLALDGTTGITIGFELQPDGYAGLYETVAYRLSNTLEVTAIDDNPTVILSGAMSDATAALLTDTENNFSSPAVAYDASIDTPVAVAGAYRVNSSYQDSPICVTAENFPQLASNTSAMLFSCWININDWGSYPDGTNPSDSSNPLAIYLMSKVMSPAGFYLTPTCLGYRFTTAGSVTTGKLPEFTEAVPTNTWVYVAVSTVNKDYQVYFNYVVGVQDGNVLKIIGSGDNVAAVGTGNSINFSAASKYTFGYTTMSGDKFAANEDFYISNITLGDYSLQSSQLGSLSGLEHYSGPAELPFTNLPSDYAAFYVPNSDQQLYILEAGQCQYLALPLAVYKYDVTQCFPWRYVRLTSTSAALAFANAFLTGGASALLDTSTQLSAETSFSDLGPVADFDPGTNNGSGKTMTATAPRVYWPVDDHVDLGGANSLYYWELFLFAPWLVAKTYHDAGTYDRAEAWYQYVFNPAKQRNAVGSVEDAALQSDADTSDLYWRFVGLRSYENALLQSERSAASQGEAVEDLMDYPLEYEASTRGSTFVVSPNISQALASYYTDAFNPHAIAVLRPVAYQKAIVMHYVQNLLDWADDLYTQCTRETIVEASLLYMQANDLLGEQPADAGNFSGSAPVTITTIRNMYGSGEATPEFLLGLEGSLSAIATPVTPTADKSLPYNFVPGLYFGIPQNSQLLAFWTQVASRLANIRGYLDINGNPLDLALFAPAINVMSLVAANAGGTLSSSLNAAQVAQTPNYRFSTLLGLAREYTGLVMQFGEKLQGILERQDAEALAQLQVSQQSTLLQMMVSSKQAAIDAANANIDAIKQSMVSALTRYVYYSGLVSTNMPGTMSWSTLTSPDATNSSFTDASMQTQYDPATDVSASFNMKTSRLASYNEGVSTNVSFGAAKTMALGTAEKLVEAPLWLLPNIFGMADGGSRVAAMFRALGDLFINVGWTESTWAGMFGTSAGYQRRSADWQLQVQLAEADISQLRAQHSAAQSQLQMAKQDYDLLQTQISQNQAIADFYTSKFTSEALYQWMAGQMTSIYNQAYRLALSTALAAQYALEYEKGMQINSLNIINTSSWNSKYKGLMAGEPLLLSLNQLERYFVDNDARRFEIVKTVSLADLLADDPNYSPLEDQLKANNATVQFELYESLFDRDYPGQYCRQIKSVSVSVPAVLGPYQDIHATLRQLGNSVVFAPDIGAVKYLTDQSSDGASGTSIRRIPSPCQAVAISSGYNDSGMFVLNFDDARYLPFEGTGAVSKWELTINDLDPQLNSNPTLSISDIIVTVRYTALYSASLDSSVRTYLAQNNGAVTTATA